jgi:polyamine oxidase
VTTDQGVYQGDSILSTASIGVLNSGSLVFDPPLPKWKTDAHSQCMMACVNKPYFKFDKKWWGDKELVLVASDTRGRWSDWLSWKHYKNNIIFCGVSGDEALRIEQLTDEQIKDEV